jgi:CRP-like cAMP-binding protein
MLSLVATILTFGYFDFSWGDFSLFKINGSYLKGVIFTLIATSALLSLKNIYKCLLLILLTGRAYNFSLSFNGLAFYFRVKSDSLFLVNNRFFLTLFHLAVAVSSFPIAQLLVSLLPEGSQFAQPLITLSLYIFIFALNPFQESEASNMLRSLFNDDTLTKVSNYLPHRSLLSLINPSERQHDNNLFVFYFHYALVWTVFFGLLHLSVFKNEIRLLSQAVQSGLIAEKLSALFVLSLGIALTVAITVNVARLLHLTLFSPFTRYVLRQYRKIKSNRLQSIKENEILDTLEVLPLFNYFSRESIKNLFQQSQLREYKPHTPVIIQGDQGVYLYTLLSGSLQVRRRLSTGRTKVLGEIHPPSLFGEVAVIEETPRSADVVTLSQSVILQTPARAIRQMAEDTQYVREFDAFRNAIMVNQFFSSAPIFKELSESVAQMFIQKGKIEHFEKDQVLFKQGDNGDGFYLLLRGAVGVSVNGRPVTRISQNGFFGEISMIADVPRTATIYALEKTQTLKVGRNAFWEILSHDISMAMLIESVGEIRIREDIEILNSSAVRVA